MYASWLSLRPCRNDTLYLKTIDWKINTFTLYCWASALYPSGKLSLLMANALKKHKSPKARLVLHCSCIVAANTNQSFWTCEVAHCPWSSVTESRPTFDMVWIIAPAWKCPVSFLKQLCPPLNCRNKRDVLNRTSSTVLGTGHWGPDFANTDVHDHLLHWGDFWKPHSSPVSLPCSQHLLPHRCREWRASALGFSLWFALFSPSLAFLPPFLCSLHPRLLVTGGEISCCLLRLETSICRTESTRMSFSSISSLSLRTQGAFLSALMVCMKHTVPVGTILPLDLLTRAKSIHHRSWLRSGLEGPNVSVFQLAAKYIMQHYRT